LVAADEDCVANVAGAGAATEALSIDFAYV